MGKRIFAEKAGRKLIQNHLLFYTPQSQIKLCEEIKKEEEFEDGVRRERVICHYVVPINERASEGLKDVFEISTSRIKDIPLFQVSEETVHENSADKSAEESTQSKKSPEVRSLSHLGPTASYTPTRRILQVRIHHSLTSLMSFCHYITHSPSFHK